MKVGDILKKEVKDTPGLQYPYKVIINEKCKYPKEQIIENEIYIENCNLFLNELYNKRSINTHTSYSLKRNNKNYSFKIFETKKNPIKKLFLRKNTVNVNNNISMHKDILPLIGNSTPKKVLKINNNSDSNSKSNSNNNSPMKISHSLFKNENIMLKNKIKKLKSLNDKETYNSTSSSLFSKKAGMTPTFRSRKMKNKMLFENLFNFGAKHKNKSIKKNSKKQTLLGSRLQNKMKNINHIIDKLNRPIFINIKTEMN